MAQKERASEVRCSQCRSRYERTTSPVTPPRREEHPCEVCGFGLEKCFDEKPTYWPIERMPWPPNPA